LLNELLFLIPFYARKGTRDGQPFLAERKSLAWHVFKQNPSMIVGRKQASKRQSSLLILLAFITSLKQTPHSRMSYFLYPAQTATKAPGDSTATPLGAWTLRFPLTLGLGNWAFAAAIRHSDFKH
jgi:hypothetical protein